MSSTTFWNLFSASLFGIILYPVIQLILTGQPLYILMIAGIMITDLLTRFFKWASRNSNVRWLKRPYNASDCNILCTNGPQGDTPGMPSGHMALVAFFIAFVYMMQIHNLDSGLHKGMFILLASIYSCLMGYDRSRRHCHTFWQIIIGYLMGLTLGVLVVFGFKSKI